MGSPLCIALGPPRKGTDGEVLGIEGSATDVFDLMGAMVSLGMNVFVTGLKCMKVPGVDMSADWIHQVTRYVQ